MMTMTTQQQPATHLLAGTPSRWMATPFLRAPPTRTCTSLAAAVVFLFEGGGEVCQVHTVNPLRIPLMLCIALTLHRTDDCIAQMLRIALAIALR
eukprot:scaffold13093_cov19-Tisochrysis_lutea.AAC.4